jgi:hypothetical protein
MPTNRLLTHAQNPTLGLSPVYEYEIEIDEKIYNFKTYNLEHIYIRGICVEVINQRREVLRGKVIQLISVRTFWKLERRHYSISQEKFGQNILIGFVRNGDILP